MNPAKTSRSREVNHRNLKVASLLAVQRKREPAGFAAVLFVPILLLPAVASAQAINDTGTLYSGVAFSVACLVVIILVGVLIRRFGKRNKGGLADDSGLDIMALKQKQLLTPEEMKMVSAAIARRMADNENKKTRTAGLTTATLLHDPEVLRLREEAAARQGQTQRPVQAGDETQGRQQQQNHVADGAQNAAVPAPAAPAWNAMPAPAEPPKPTVSTHYTPGRATIASKEQSPRPPQIDTADLQAPTLPGDPIPPDYTGGELVQVPLEVQKLADAGLITAEELANIKERLRNRQ